MERIEGKFDIGDSRCFEENGIDTKRGKLSKGEMDYIRQNCFDLSLEEIADNIERTVETVRSS